MAVSPNAGLLLWKQCVLDTLGSDVFVNKTHPQYGNVKTVFDSRKQKLQEDEENTKTNQEQQQQQSNVNNMKKTVWKEACLEVAKRDFVKKTDPEYPDVLD